MGVPVFSLYDSEYYFHPQNVSCSILTNSGMPEYVLKSESEIFDKIQELLEEKQEYWTDLKTTTRNKFLNGSVCNKQEYMKNFQELLTKLYDNRKIV